MLAPPIRDSGSICRQIMVSRINNATPTPAQSVPAITHWIPALRWLSCYDRAWFRGDVVAGVTLAAYLVPSAIGDASLAGLPPEAGLYACLFSGLTFWLFCSSKHTAIAVTSAISLLLGSSLGGMAGGDAGRFGALASGTALLVAVIAFVAWLIRAGAIVSFISESVMVGFKCGVALFLASTQLPKLFGFHGTHGDFWENSCPFSPAPERNEWRVARHRRCRVGRSGARQDLPEAQAGRIVRRRGQHHGIVAARPRIARRQFARRSAARAAGRWLAGHSLVGLERSTAVGVRVFSARRRGNGGHRPHVYRQARWPIRRQPRVRRAGRCESCRRPRPRISGQWRHVAIHGQRRRRRTHAAVGCHRGRLHPRGRSFLFAPAACVTPAGFGGGRAGSGGRPVQALNPQAPLALRSGRIRRGDRRLSWVCWDPACCVAS